MMVFLMLDKSRVFPCPKPRLLPHRTGFLQVSDNVIKRIKRHIRSRANIINAHKVDKDRETGIDRTGK